jgi:hypothetical protein
MKIAVLLFTALTQSILMVGNAQSADLDTFYRHQSMNNNMGPSDTFGARVAIGSLGPLDTLLIGAEQRSWKMLGVKTTGSSFDATGFYKLGSMINASTQVQLGSSALYPKSTIYQELGFKTNDAGSVIVGVGAGHINFNNGSSSNVFKVGPTVYLSAPLPMFFSYRYSHYTNDGYNHSLSGRVDLSTETNLGFAYQSGAGKYFVNTIFPASVKGDSIEINLQQAITKTIAATVKIGQTNVDNKLTGGNVYRSNDLTFGLRFKF